MSSPTAELFATDDRATRDLQIAYEAMRGGPYDHQGGLANALKLVQAHAVSVIGNAHYHVKGRTQTYEVDALCSCDEATRRNNAFCLHRAAVHLYTLWHTRRGDPLMAIPTAPLLPLGPVTIEERLAQETPQMPQDDADARRIAREPGGQERPPASLREAPGTVVRFPLPSGRLLRPLHAIIADLRRPLPDDCIPSFKGPGGADIEYLSWRQITHLLHTYAPGWYCEVGQIQDMDAFTLTLRLVILSAEGRTAYEGIGRDDPPVTGARPNMYGDRARRSYARALKHAAQLLGMDWLQEEDKHHASLAALTQYLHEEQAARIKDLGTACERAGLDKTAYVAALLRQAGVRSWKHIPVAMLADAVSCVEAYVTDAP